MSKPLRTPDDYELFLYTLTEQFSVIIRSTVTFIRIGATLARVAGELYFDYEFRLVVRERLIFDRLPVVMDWYGYEVWKGGEKLFWYDSQPHPDDSTGVAKVFVVRQTSYRLIKVSYTGQYKTLNETSVNLTII